MNEKFICDQVEVPRHRRTSRKEGAMKKKTTNAFIPIFRTPRSIANDSKVHVSKIWSVIFCHNIQPTAMADETPIFNEASAKEIMKLAKKVTK